jgi:serine O-acetyltransferase
MKTWEIILEDLARGWDRKVPCSTAHRWAMVLSCAGTVRGLATIGFRISHALGKRSSLAGAIFKQINQLLTGCDIGHEAQIGPGLRMLHPNGVVINPKTVIGKRFTIHSSVTLGGDPLGAPEIGDDVNIAPGARVLGFVKIGDRVRVGANAVMTRTIETAGVVASDVIIAGVPAKILRSNSRR